MYTVINVPKVLINALAFISYIIFCSPFVEDSSESLKETLFLARDAHFVSCSHAP